MVLVAGTSPRRSTGGNAVTTVVASDRTDWEQRARELRRVRPPMGGSSAETGASLMGASRELQALQQRRFRHAANRRGDWFDLVAAAAEAYTDDINHQAFFEVAGVCGE